MAAEEPLLQRVEAGRVSRFQEEVVVEVLVPVPPRGPWTGQALHPVLVFAEQEWQFHWWDLGCVVADLCYADLPEPEGVVCHGQDWGQLPEVAGREDGESNLVPERVPVGAHGGLNGPQEAVDRLPEVDPPNDAFQSGELARDREGSRPDFLQELLRCAGTCCVCEPQRGHGTDVRFVPVDPRHDRRFTAHSNSFMEMKDVAVPA